MGGALRKHWKSKPREDVAELKQAIHRLEEEVERSRNEREAEKCARRKELATKQAEWRQEKKRLEEEVSALASCCRGEGGMQLLELKESEWSHFLAEQMKEQKQREEAVERWKRLYLVIKNELDQLIQATALLSNPHPQGDDNFCIQWLKEELKAKEEQNEQLKAKVVEMEKESAKREREVDILRQSLRIMTTHRSSKR